MTAPPLPVLRSLLGSDVRAIENARTSGDLGGSAHEGTLGVHRVNGTALTPDGERSFALIVKRMRAGGDPRLGRQIDRELSIYAQPGDPLDRSGFRPARSYGCIHEGDGAVSLYLEDLTEYGKRAWTDDDYVDAAGALGRFHGGSSGSDSDAAGSSAIRGFPAVPEIAESIARARAERDLFREHAVRRFCALWDGAARVMTRLDGLPRVFSHGDCHCLNLFLLRDYDEVVAIDWAYAGMGCVGEDLGSMVTAEYCWRTMSIARFIDLEPRVYVAYKDGLHAGGYRDDDRHARRGYVAMIALDAGWRMLFALSRMDVTDEEVSTDYVTRLTALVPYLEEAGLD